MTRAETVAYNAGVAALAEIAAASAFVLRGRLVEKPTRYSFAVAALEGIVEAAESLMLPPPPDAQPSAAGAPGPAPRLGGAAAEMGASA